MVNGMNKVIMVKCPTCETEFSYYTSEFRPFCCEKCKLVDLGHWFHESYKVPAKDQDIKDNSNEGNSGEQKNPEEDIDDESEYL